MKHKVKIGPWPSMQRHDTTIGTTEKDNCSMLKDCMFLSCYDMFRSESTLYGCLNVTELPAQNSSDIWSLVKCNWTRTHNQLVRKQTLNHLTKLKCSENREICGEVIYIKFVVYPYVEDHCKIIAIDSMK